jgi:hypothetical protein
MKTYFTFFVWIAVEVRSVLLDNCFGSAAVSHACSPLPVPLSPGSKWDTGNEDSEIFLPEDDHTWYRSLIGRLNWLAVETRPDIKFAVMKLQHRTASPKSMTCR